MSTTTTNYGLIKPDTTDPILIGQLNDNSDAIDAALKENADAIENKPDAADIPTPSTAAPAMDGTAAAGTSTDYARADHVHPSDTSKQDALTAAQLAAANSGIDSTKVEQIETNKNNILSLTANGGGKNYFNPQSVTYEPSGANVTYSLSGDTIALSTTSLPNVSELNIKEINFPLNKDLILTGCPANTGYTIQIDAFNNSAYISGSADTGSGSRPFRFTTMTNSYLRIRIGANTSFTNLQFKIMVRDSNTDSTYQPHAMSNAELTAKEQQNENNISNISTSLDVSRLTLNYVTNSYIDETTFNRLEMRKVAPHIAVFNLNIYNASIGVTSDFVEFGTITGATIAQTAMIQQGNLIIYLQGGTNKLKVYCSSAGTYTLRTSITIVI